MKMPVDGGFTGFDTLSENIEERILDSIRKGISSGENRALRPLREVFQNCDDELADRFYIMMDDDAMYFLNDGHRLSVEINAGGKAVGGTARMITGIAMASKRKDRGRAGEFGTGLRSAHAISHTIEVTGKVTQFDIVGENEDGTKILEESPQSKQPKGAHTAVSNAYERDLLNSNDSNLPFEVRGKESRPKRMFLPKSDVQRDGIMVRLPWRREVYPGSNDPPEWDDFVWDDDSIDHVVNLYIKEIPRILLGCSWLREVVFEVNTKKQQRSFAWSRDFNQREILTDSVVDVSLTSYESNKFIGIESGLKFDLNTMSTLDVESFRLITMLNDDIDEIAEKAKLLSTLHILMPKQPSENLPAYTPIALVGDCGNLFGPTAYLPPDDSRTKIKIDGVKRERQLWAAVAINRMTQKLLPTLLTQTTQWFKDEPQHMLSMLPRVRTDKWYTSGEGMGKPNYDGSSATSSITAAQLSDAWQTMERSWVQYTTEVCQTPLMMGLNGSLTTFSDVICVEIDDQRTKQVITKILNQLGKTTLTAESEEILSQLSSEDWGDNHPYEQFHKLSSPRDIAEMFTESGEKMTVKLLGNSLVKELMEVMYVKPCEQWANDANTDYIPAIPDADGILRPLKSDDGDDQFYLDSNEFPDLLSNSRRIHNDFIDLTKGIDLKSPDPLDFARFIHEKGMDLSEIFNNLSDHETYHRQISGALVKMAETGIKSPEIAKYKFIPTRNKKTTVLKEWNQIGQNVWGMGKSITYTSFYDRSFIFSDNYKQLKGLELHSEIIDNLFFLDLHKDYEEHRDSVASYLVLNKIDSTQAGLNLFRTLIFGQSISGWTNHQPISIFTQDADGKDELENWLGTSIPASKKNKILDSLLKLLAKTAAEGGIKGGWGANSRTQVHNLPLLRDADGKWSKLSELCYDVSDEVVSNLFGKRGIDPEHKAMLGAETLTNPVNPGADTRGGLGITHQIEETDIIEKLNSLPSQNVRETRMSILKMMLESEKPWNLEGELPRMRWIYAENDDLCTFDDLYLPTPDMVKLFGRRHPKYLKTDADCSNASVMERASELGVRFDVEDAQTIVEALYGPESVWPSLTGHHVLNTLKQIEDEQPAMLVEVPAKRNRLPDRDGVWEDDVWFVSESIVDAMALIFPDKTLRSKRDLKNDELEMLVRRHLLSGSYEPSLPMIQEKIEIATAQPLAALEVNQIKALWDVILHYGDKFEVMGSKWIPFVRGETITRLGSTFVTNSEDCKQLTSEYPELTFISEDEPIAELLISKFNVCDLDSFSRLEQQIPSMKVYLEKSAFSQSSISAYWILLATIPKYSEEFTKREVWLYKSNDGYDFCSLTMNAASRRALIPKDDETLENINRLISEMVPLIWLPRVGSLQESIYEKLHATDKKIELPTMERVARPKQIAGNQLTTVAWPYLTQALQNVLTALIHLDALNVLSVDTVEVQRTEMKISSALYVQVRHGGREVFWKDGVGASSQKTEYIQPNIISVIISTNTEKLDDSILEQSLSRYIKRNDGGKAMRQLRYLLRNSEDKWSEEYPSLEGEDFRYHPRELISEGYYNEKRDDLIHWYGGCQICKQQTPSDRHGGYQESLIQIFKLQGGRYSTRKPQRYSLGNVMYLCPVHKSLYSRSGQNKLFWIPQIDEILDDLKRNPTQETLDSYVENVLKTEGNLTLPVMTYEKREGDGEEDATEHKWEVTWEKEHAARFKDALIQYLSGFVR